MSEICYIWGFTDILWKNADWTWSECKIIQDILDGICGNKPGVDATTLIQPWLNDPWNPYRAGEKKKKLIRLICKVKGIEYDESKEVRDLDVSVEDIKLVINKVLNINVKGTK
jgi:hypothetical protein